MNRPKISVATSGALLGVLAITMTLSGCFLNLFGGTVVTLSGIDLSEGTISPAFDPEVTEYEATVVYATAQMGITIKSEIEDVEITVDGSSLPGDGTATVGLSPGVNDIVIEAALGRRSQTYTVAVNRFGPELEVTGPETLGGQVGVLTSGTLVDFGLVPYTTIPTIDFTINNIGNAALTLTEAVPNLVVIDPAGDIEIYVDTQPASSTIDPGGSVTFVMASTEDGSGSLKYGSVDIPNDDPDEGTFTLDFVSESDAY